MVTNSSRNRVADGSLRIALPKGAMLVDARLLGRPPDREAERIFAPDYWSARGELEAAARGRGSAWFIATSNSTSGSTPAANPGTPRRLERWVLRHYRRGGQAARLSVDRFVWAGEDRVRAFAEWRLLRILYERGLPVPEPIAARYERGRFTYRCDVMMRRIEAARPLSVLIEARTLSVAEWRTIGAVLARFHGAGVDHADLNANNVLVDARGRVSLIDFDRGRLRAPGAWRRANLARLHRSLGKLARALPPDRFTAEAWEHLLAAYRAAAPPR
jgi:3-deoxy-D-manno-octulosonic acid kinase